MEGDGAGVSSTGAGDSSVGSGEGVGVSSTGAVETDVVLVYEDNGVGINHSPKNSPESFGMNLISLLTGQLRGTLTVEERAGTYIKIQFPAL